MGGVSYPLPRCAQRAKLMDTINTSRYASVHKANHSPLLPQLTNTLKRKRTPTKSGLTVPALFLALSFAPISSAPTGHGLNAPPPLSLLFGWLQSHASPPDQGAHCHWHTVGFPYYSVGLVARRSRVPARADFS